jgi:multicomponent Na+:H+ antiporter subunit E
VKQVILPALALAVLWLLLSGHLEPLILIFGALSIAFVIWIAQRMHVIDGESYPFGLIPRLSGYWLWLLKEIVKSSLDTSRRALGPKSAVQPVVFNVPATQRTDLGLVIHANSITLTPGTVTLDLDEDRIRVHALHPDVARDAISSDMDRRVPDIS